MLRFSIITVAYNSESTIRNTIDSVLGQSYPHIEYIIIDGNSKDRTVEIVQLYGGKIQKFITEPDQGIYDAMNKGIGLASGDVIGILNSDDFYADSKVIENVNAAFRKSNADAVFGDLVFINQHQKIVRRWRAGNYRMNAFKWGWMPPHPTFFVRKEVYQKHGLFNLSLCSSADYELMLRFLHKYRIHVKYVPEVLVVMRTGGQSTASVKNRIRANREDKKAWAINHLKPYPFTLFIKPLLKVIQFVVIRKRMTF